MWSSVPNRAPFGARSEDRELWRIPQNPAPTTYEIERRRAFKPQSPPFGSKRERSAFDADRNPSPADYDIESPRRVRDMPDCPFSQRAPRFERFRQNNECTAPGQYDIDRQSTVDATRLREVNSPAFKASSERDPFPVTELSPGPGEYHPAKNVSHRLPASMDGIERSPTNTFGGQQIPRTPGPAAYSIHRNHTPGGYMRHTARNLFNEKPRAPPPGAYDVSGSLFRPSMNATFNRKLE
jgi:hypothetical protein